jgi:hypothetical protein
MAGTVFGIADVDRKGIPIVEVKGLPRNTDAIVIAE